MLEDEATLGVLKVHISASRVACACALINLARHEDSAKTYCGLGYATDLVASYLAFLKTIALFDFMIRTWESSQDRRPRLKGFRSANTELQEARKHGRTECETKFTISRA